MNIGQYGQKCNICSSQRKAVTNFGYLHYSLLFR